MIDLVQSGIAFLLLCLNLSDVCFLRTPLVVNDPDIVFPDPGVLTGAQSCRQPLIVRAHRWARVSPMSAGRLSARAGDS